MESDRGDTGSRENVNDVNGELIGETKIEVVVVK